MYCVLPYYTVMCYALLCLVFLYYIVLFYTVLCRTFMYWIALYCTVLYCTVPWRYIIALPSRIRIAMSFSAKKVSYYLQYFYALYCFLLYCIVLHYTVLRCTVLHCQFTQNTTFFLPSYPLSFDTLYFPLSNTQQNGPSRGVEGW